jgi:geranylgeranyl pyrophosphate synthase
MNPDRAYPPVAREMKQVQDCLAHMITASSDPVVRQMSTALLESTGKRLRPALVCLCAKIASNGNTEPCGEDLIRVAAAVELIHLASLIHDDVVDRTFVRRGRPSINAQLGNEISIVLGDYVYCKALRLISTCASCKVLARVCDAIHDMCEGELSQVCRRGHWELPEQDYIAMVKKKTASLFSVSCCVGAMIGQASDDVEAGLADFGLNLGIAYQIADDYRDVLTGEAALGKPPGQDLRMGDVTLPLMKLRQGALESQRVKMDLAEGSDVGMTSLDALRDLAESGGAMNLTRETAYHYIDRAERLLDRMPESDSKTCLRGLAGGVVRSLR